MLISPEYYYEENLKGKTVQEIQSKIRGLKSKITRLKRKMENADDFEQNLPGPSLATQLTYTRQYLEKAKQALVEAGGSYKPSQAEQKADLFDSSLHYISKIIFSVGAYTSDNYEKRIVTFDENHLYMASSSSFYVSLDDVERIKDYPCGKDEFLYQLKALHIGEWNLSYSNPFVLDGTHWNLEIHFSNEHKEVRIWGSNTYPYNFKDFCNLMGIEGKLAI